MCFEAEVETRWRKPGLSWGEWQHLSEAEGEASSVTQVYMNAYMTPQKIPAFPWKPTTWNGEGGIRTHGTVTRTTVFEFYDSHADLSHPVPKRVVWFAIPSRRSWLVMPSAVLCRAVGLQFGLQTPHRLMSVYPVNST